jgi:hypothetical protein
VVHDGSVRPPRPGYYQGRHYTTYVEEVKALKRSGDNEAVEWLLLALIDATEAESRANEEGVAPACIPFRCSQIR